MAFDLHEPTESEVQQGKKREIEYSMVLHDGTGVTESETFRYKFDGNGQGEEGREKEAHGLAGEVLGRIVDLQREKKMDVSQ